MTDDDIDDKGQIQIDLWNGEKRQLRGCSFIAWKTKWSTNFISLRIN